MYVFSNSTSELSPWIRKEVEHERDLEDGARGMAVQRVQEWLNLHKHGVTVDSEFGPATRTAIESFQHDAGLQATGRVDAATFALLVEPMLSVLRRLDHAGADLPAATIAYGQAHLAVHPIEVGGQNRGPWVRLYTGGKDGEEWAWCSAFVCFLMHQAAETLGVDPPIPGSVSCDSVVAQAREAGCFRSEADAQQLGVPDGSIFLVRRTATDWTHDGLVVHAAPTTFTTIEGNTNDEGSREGFEVCARTRSYPDKDFVLLG